MADRARKTADEPDERPGSAMEHQPRLGRAGMVFCVIVLPIAIVITLWFMMDRSRGQPRPDMSGALGPGQRAPTGGEAPALPK